MAIARQNGKLRGKQPRLKPAPDREIRRMHDSGNYNVAEIAALFSVSRPTVYRSLERTTALPASRRGGIRSFTGWLVFVNAQAPLACCPELLDTSRKHAQPQLKVQPTASIGVSHETREWTRFIRTVPGMAVSGSDQNWIAGECHDQS